MNILLVDDAKDDQLIVANSLGKDHAVLIAASLAEARKTLERKSVDLILLDILLPDGNGFDFCSDLQAGQKTKAIPIIFLSVRSEVSDKVMGFQLGAEDYISKPFHVNELRARVESRLKRIGAAKMKDMSLELGSLRLSLSLQRAYSRKEGKEELLDLTPLEFKLLVYLAQHEEHVFSREHLLEVVWGKSLHVADRTVDMHVSNLRKKLVGSSHVIRSVHGVGYQFQRAS